VYISAADEKWMSKFFTDFFLEGSAIYTLFGTKPMSQTTLIDASEEEWINSATPYLDKEGEERKKEIESKIRDHYRNYDLSANWEKWMEWRKTWPHSPFLYRKEQVPGSKILFSAHIINVPEVAWILEKHYPLFSRELNMEFDPLDATLEFEDPHSVFWNKTFANHLLQGILYGYGERNAYFFSRQFAKHKKYIHPFDECMLGAGSSIKNEPQEGSLEKLQLPLFRSYSPLYGQDPIITKYEKERETIQKRLKGKNFTEEVLKRVTMCI
jgi:hypothetical protein